MNEACGIKSAHDEAPVKRSLIGKLHLASRGSSTTGFHLSHLSPSQPAALCPPPTGPDPPSPEQATPHRAKSTALRLPERGREGGPGASGALVLSGPVDAQQWRAARQAVRGYMSAAAQNATDRVTELVNIAEAYDPAPVTQHAAGIPAGS